MNSPHGSPSLPEVFGRYRVRRLLGSGTMGAVYVADDTQLQRQVAIKIPKLQNNSSRELLERFYLEARSAATLRNPNICPVFDVGEIEGQHFISMAYIEGKTLAEILRNDKSYSERQTLLLVRKLALALQDAHNHGIIHRDLKPGNIIIDSRGEPVVMDFGLAFHTRMDAARLTATGQLVGSPAYMSPEQIEGDSKKLTPAVDQYALGVILYELLTGELPFQGSITSVINQILTKPNPSPRLLRPDMNPRVEELCLQMLAKQPEQRFSSMQDVADHATAILKAKPDAEGVRAITTQAPGVATSTANVPPVSFDSLRERVEAKLEKGELRDALEIAKDIAAMKDAKTAEWGRQQYQQITKKIRERKKQTEILCNVAAKLIRDHDYAEAINVLSSVPAAERTEELQDLLSDAQDKEEESSLLLNDIKEAIAHEQPKELTPLIKRYLQLKPGNSAIRSLSEDLKKYGAEEVIRIRRRQQNYFDPVPPVFNPIHLGYAVAGISALALSIYLWTLFYLVPMGTVIIEVHDPKLSIDFRNQVITDSASESRFRLKTSATETLRVNLDGGKSVSQVITVANRETKRITARMVDGKLNLQITSDQETFSTPNKEITAGSKSTAGNQQSDQSDNTSVSPVKDWVDLISETDPQSVSGSKYLWKRESDRLIGELKDSRKSDWLLMIPTREFSGDYDLELDFLLIGSEYMQVGLPLNETVGTLSFGTRGASLHWIDGQGLEWDKISPPHGNEKISLAPGVLQKLRVSVRHLGENVSIEAQIGGVLASRFLGLRSRISTPKETFPRPNQLKLVSQFQGGIANSRMEISKLRLRLLAPQTGKSSLGEEQKKPNPSAAPAAATAATATRIVLDADFTKSNSGFRDLDVDHILSEHKNGEYRFVGKKTGWWWNAIEPAVGRSENSHLDDFTLEYDLRLVGKKKGWFSIRFGLAQRSRLGLCFDETGRIRLVLGGSTTIVPPTLPRNLKPVDQFNTVRMTVENKSVRVSVNGEPLFEKRLEQYVGSSVRIWIEPDEIPFDARLQRYKLETPINSKPRLISREIRKLAGHKGRIRGLAFLPDNERAVSVGDDKEFKLWDITTGKLIQDIEGHPANVTSVSVSQDGHRALTGCADGQARLWDLETMKVLKVLKGHARPIVSVILSRDGKTGLTAADDGSIRRWDLKIGVASKIVSGPGTGTSIAISADEKTIAAANSNGQVLVQRATEGCTLIGHSSGAVGGIAFTPDNSKIVTASDDGTMRLWNLSNCKEIHRFDGDGTSFESVSVTNDGRYAIAGNIDGKLYLWDLQTGDKVNEILAETSINQILALSNNNGYVLTAGEGDNELHLWKLPNPVSPIK